MNEEILNEEIKEEQTENTEGKKKIHWKRHAALYLVEGLLLIAAVFILLWVTRATKMQKVNLDQSQIAVNDRTSSTSEEGTGEGSAAQDENGDVMSTAPEASAEPTVDKDAISQELYDRYSGLFNIAFFGVDSREGELGKGTRSDSIMI